MIMVRKLVTLFTTLNIDIRATHVQGISFTPGTTPHAAKTRPSSRTPTPAKIAELAASDITGNLSNNTNRQYQASFNAFLMFAAQFFTGNGKNSIHGTSLALLPIYITIKIILQLQSAPNFLVSHTTINLSCILTLPNLTL